jgi:hypothetical protein
MSFDMSGTTVVDVTAMAALTTVTSTGAGGVQVRNTGTKLASVTTGAGADSVRLNTTTVRDDVNTTADETVNASASTGAGADTVYIATTSATAGFGNTTVDTGADGDTVYIQSVSSGAASINTADGNDTIHLNVVGGLGANPGLTINGGSGTDTLAMLGGGALTAVDYARLNAAVSGIEVVRLTSATSGIDASKLNIGTLTGFTITEGANTLTEVGAGQTITFASRATATAASDFVPALAASVGTLTLNASAAGYVQGTGSTATVYGGALNIANAGNTLTLKGSSATVGVTASSTVAPIVTLAASDVQSLTVNLSSTRTATGTGSMAEFRAETVTDTSAGTYNQHLEGLSSLKVNGSGRFSIDTSGVNPATLANLTTIDLSGMTALSEINVTTGAIVTPNVSRSTITLNGLVAETVVLGGARDRVVTGSTFPLMDTITGFQLTADATTPTLVDLTRSDELSVGGGGFAKFTTTATTLIGALTAAGASATARLVFQFGGDTYVYVDAGALGLDDGDTVVKLTGNYDLDLLIQGGVLI